MKIKRIDSHKDVEQECDRIDIKVGGSVITLMEEGGQLKVFGDESDLMISCGSRNSFTVVTKPIWPEDLIIED
ncbi:conserved hypothetical protein [Vibrio chagasii]|nr:conserved hypothetical protein [Vibrio chagasii]